MYNIQGNFVVKNFEKFTDNETSNPTTKPTESPTIAKAASDAVDNIIGPVNTENHYCIGAKLVGSNPRSENRRACKITVDGGIPDDGNLDDYVTRKNPYLKKDIIDKKACGRWTSYMNSFINSDEACKTLSDNIKTYKDHIKNGCKNKNDYSNLEDNDAVITFLKDVGLWKFGVPEKFSELYYCINNKSVKKLEAYAKGCKNDNQCMPGFGGVITRCSDNTCLDDAAIELGNAIEEGANAAYNASFYSSLMISLFCLTCCYVLFFK
jgi:hypothetical protein